MAEMIENFIEMKDDGEKLTAVFYDGTISINKNASSEKIREFMDKCCARGCKFVATSSVIDVNGKKRLIDIDARRYIPNKYKPLPKEVSMEVTFTTYLDENNKGESNE